MKRRRLLSSAAFALSGCASLSTDRKATGTTRTTNTTPKPNTVTNTTKETETTISKSFSRTVGETISAESGLKLTISDCWIQHSLIWANFPDALTVTAHEGKQFVFVLVSGTGDVPPPRSAFTLSLDGTTYWPKSEFENEPLELVDSDHDEKPYQTQNERQSSYGNGWLLFEIPDETAGEMAIGWEGEDATAEWSLTDNQVSAFTAPRPKFEIVSFDVPGRAESIPFEMSVTVRNVGDGDGSFRGVLNQRGNMVLTWFTLSVPAGETRTWRYDYRHHAEKLALVWEDGTIDRDVEIG
ncbi:hypothetical protein [Haladaptatus cibarius]|uniref:hypothetical protein n=1 Tax=Haladaptatus cibarius TaxID=453847 RepID=UPI00067904FA|nr:hypothetical protein [Haladaptatus cibarius]